MAIVLICYFCSAHIPHTPAYPGIRSERDRRGQWRRHPDFLVNCPYANDPTLHSPTSGWNWVSKAKARGADWLRTQRAITRREVQRAQGEAKSDSD